MNPPPSRPSEDGDRPRGLLRVPLRHKGIVLACSLLGFGIAALLAFREFREPAYTSEAKLLVHYMADVIPTEGIPRPMDAEREILKSWDLATSVALAVGPGKLSAGTATDKSVAVATERIASGLEVTLREGSRLIEIRYRDRAPELTAEVLEQWIDCYFLRHLEIHRGPERGVSDWPGSTIPNLSVIQQPTAPARSWKHASPTGILGIAASGIVIGLGLAFLLEWRGGRRVA